MRFVPLDPLQLMSNLSLCQCPGYPSSTARVLARCHEDGKTLRDLCRAPFTGGAFGIHHGSTPEFGIHRYFISLRRLGVNPHFLPSPLTELSLWVNSRVVSLRARRRGGKLGEYRGREALGRGRDGSKA